MLAQIINETVSLVLTTTVFAMIYKLMPRVRVRWQDVWLGALVTAVLFTIGKFLIGFYIGKSGIASGFGAAGSLVIILVWVYYSAQIFLIGAEFTHVYARAFPEGRELPGESSGGSGKAIRAEVPSRLATDDPSRTEPAGLSPS